MYFPCECPYSESVDLAFLPARAASNCFLRSDLFLGLIKFLSILIFTSRKVGWFWLSNAFKESYPLRHRSAVGILVSIISAICPWGNLGLFDALPFLCSHSLGIVTIALHAATASLGVPQLTVQTDSVPSSGHSIWAWIFVCADLALSSFLFA